MEIDYIALQSIRNTHLKLSYKDYLIMEQFVKELSGNYSIQETTEDLSKHEIEEQYFV